MAENFKSRIIQKHDTSENWSNATSFIPKQGEIIIYDIDDVYDYERFKIGDGVTNVNSLPFVDDNVKTLLNTLVGDVPVSEQISIAVGDHIEDVDMHITEEERALWNSTTDKKEKDLIVTYQENSTFGVTHSSEEVLNAVNNGRTVKFKKDTELLDLLEVTADYATFYMLYVNMQNKIQQRIVVIGGNSIMLEQDDVYDFVTKTDLTNTLKNYYNKTETANYVDSRINTMETITVADIDAICGMTISN